MRVSDLWNACQIWRPPHSWKSFKCQQPSLDAVRFMMKHHGEASMDVHLLLQARNLCDKDYVSKSDPMVVVELCEANGDVPVWSEIGRTEIIANDLNPKWMQPIIVNYRFNVVQCLRFTVYDVDTAAHKCSDVRTVKLEDQEYLGQTNCCLPELLRARGQALTRELKANHNDGGSTTGHVSKPRHAKFGTLTIHAEEAVSDGREEATLQFRAKELDRMDPFFFGKSDPYLKVSRILEDGSSAVVFQTKTVRRDLNPVWDPIVIPLQNLCRGDPLCPLRIECFDHDTFGVDDLIGSVDRSVRQLAEDAELSREVRLTRRSHKEKNKPAKVGGTLLCTRCEITRRKSFLHYLSMGCEISFHVAVDFTASNGDPKTPGSLHYLDPRGTPNAYQQAISAVGGVIEFYDTDKLFPAWGFGANVGSGFVSHCFNLNGDQSNAEVSGVAGILEAYARACTVVSLSGPTLFSPVITKSSEMAEAHSREEGRLKYSVLLIITDGIINDMESTINAIVAASRLPLSILIVGVGSADFSEMEALDGDDGPLKFEGRKCQRRDIVQFVSMQKITSSYHLACELLAELPHQLVQFMSYALPNV